MSTSTLGDAPVPYTVEKKNDTAHSSVAFNAKPDVFNLGELRSTNKRRTQQGYVRLLIILSMCFVIVILQFQSYTTLQGFRSDQAGDLNESLIHQQSSIVWTACGTNLQCGHLTLPLDYTGAKSGNASVALIRYPVKDRTSRLGSLFINPGGPGNSGVGFVRRNGQRLATLTGGKYDIVSWDPRGIGSTTPSIKCFDTRQEQVLFFTNTHEDYPVAGTWNFSKDRDISVFRSHYRIAHAQQAVLAEICISKIGNILPFVGTTTVVRDLERIATAIDGPDELINYWGMSYGTVIGLYLVNMFPHRVGKVILDGVGNPVTWATAHSYNFTESIFVDSELVLKNFNQECASAGPKRCALASNSSTAETIEKEIDAFASALMKKPLPSPDAQRPGILTAGMLKAFMYGNLYRPRDWPKMASFISLAMNQDDGAPILKDMLKSVEHNASTPADPWYAGYPIICLDGADRTGEDEESIVETAFRSTIHVGRDLTPHFPGLMVDYCHHWVTNGTRPKERFVGPFNRTLSNTILVIGNTADPATPLANARAVNDLLADSSRLVIHNASGHGTLAQASLCTTRIITTYLNEGALPENGVVCNVDEQIFPSSGFDGILLKEGSAAYAHDDIRLLEAVKVVGESLRLKVF